MKTLKYLLSKQKHKNNEFQTSELNFGMEKGGGYSKM